jgi:hypothetical protein
MRSLESGDSEEPLYTRYAAAIANVAIWRNSDCQFSSVDCQNVSQKSADQNLGSAP